jgi:hypothetical protein
MDRIVTAVMQAQALSIERRAHEAHVAAVKREERWGGLRSIAIFTAIASVMVGMLLAGTMT